LPLGRLLRLRIVLSFAVCDGLAPLIGLAIGSAIVRFVAPWTGWLGPLVLGGVGLYTLLVPREEQCQAGEGWLCLGLPLALSLDNLIAGFGLGALGTPVVLAAAVIGLISGLMSLAGLCLSSVVSRVLPTRAEQIGGVALTALALLLALDVF
jgi:putative Mn2+ efflux pump MntP